MVIACADFNVLGRPIAARGNLTFCPQCKSGEALQGELLPFHVARQPGFPVA